MSVDDFAVFSKGTICSQFIDSVPMLEKARAASQVEMKLSVLLERRSEWEANFVAKYGIELGHEATENGLAYAPVSQAHGHNHIVQCFACCTAA